MAHLAHNAIDFFSTPITVFEAVWSYEMGENTLIADPDYIIIGVIQPLSDASLQALPELQRMAVSFLLFTRAILKISRPGEGDKNSYIRHRNGVYKAKIFADWYNQSFNRYGLETVESMEGR